MTEDALDLPQQQRQDSLKRLQQSFVPSIVAEKGGRTSDHTCDHTSDPTRTTTQTGALETTATEIGEDIIPVAATKVEKKTGYSSFPPTSIVTPAPPPPPPTALYKHDYAMNSRAVGTFAFGMKEPSATLHPRNRGAQVPNFLGEIELSSSHMRLLRLSQLLRLCE